MVYVERKTRYTLAFFVPSYIQEGGDLRGSRNEKNVSFSWHIEWLLDTLTTEKSTLRLGQERPLQPALASKAPRRKKWKINVPPIFMRFNGVIFLKQNTAPITLKSFANGEYQVSKNGVESLLKGQC